MGRWVDRLAGLPRATANKHSLGCLFTYHDAFSIRCKNEKMAKRMVKAASGIVIGKFAFGKTFI